MKRSFRRFKNNYFLLLFCLLWLACASPEERIVSKPRSYTIQIKQMQFQPAELTVHAGDTVVFVNQDMVAHDVTEETRKAWASGPMPTGASWKMVATDDADYYCSIHAVMKGKILLAK
jgi:plastocyanin